MVETWTTILEQAAGKNATGIVIPAEIIAALGTSKKPKVVASLNGYRYRSTVAPTGAVWMLPVSAEHRLAAGIKAGDQVEVTLELDTEPRTVAVPHDVTTALATAGATAAFEALAFSKRKEHVRQVEEAKTQETRQRRIANIVAKLSES